MENLSRENANWLRDHVAPMLRCLGGVRRQLERRGFVRDHPLLRAVNAAWAGLHWLHMEAHYESCKGGVGSPARDDEPAT
jgi:hypothetical protein